MFASLAHVFIPKQVGAPSQSLLKSTRIHHTTFPSQADIILCLQGLPLLLNAGKLSQDIVIVHRFLYYLGQEQHEILLQHSIKRHLPPLAYLSFSYLRNLHSLPRYP